MSSLARKLGGRRPAARFIGYTLLGTLGFYRRDRHVDFGRVQRLVFVCSGNICRSPYGEALARMRGVPTVSFGLHANGIAAADPTATRVAALEGVSLGRHVSTRAADYEPLPGDLLLTMEPWQLAEVRGLVGSSGAQVTLLGLWCRRPLPYLPDPYGKSDECFRHVFDLVAEGVGQIGARLPDWRPLERSVS
jgi:protein-tyrosine phosphatase